MDLGAGKCIPCKASIGPAAAVATPTRPMLAVGGRIGARALAVSRSVAGVSVILGGAYFVWTAI